MEGLYLVTDRELCGGRSIEWVVSRAVSGGVRYVQLREKDTSTRAFIDLALERLTDSNEFVLSNEELAIAEQQGRERASK